MNEWKKEVFVEQPLALPGSAINLTQLLSQNMVHLQEYQNLVAYIYLSIYVQKVLGEKKSNLKYFFDKCGGYKSKYNLKPLLSQNMVHFAWKIKSLCIDKLNI